jgi:hypothetical protein
MEGWHSRMRSIGLAVVVGLAMSGPSPARADVPIDPALLAVREAAWRAWFAGDVAALRELLPPEFTGISWNDTPFTNQAETLAASTAFKNSGGRLVGLAFPETRAQRFGDVVVLYGRFEAVIEAPGGRQTVRGRLTELFVRRDGKWLHPGWHLDAVGPRPPVGE